MPGALPTGPVTTLKLAGPLAVAPDGLLYVVEESRQRNGGYAGIEVLVRWHGQFKVVAGDDKKGFSGDGAKAVDAELSDVTDIAFSPHGNLFIADGPRIREVATNGVIKTVAGSGRNPPAVLNGKRLLVKNGVPALRASLTDVDGLSIAFSTKGKLFIGTFNQLLRLTDNGRLDTVRTVIQSGPYRGKSLNEFEDLALNDKGDVYSSCGQQGWAIYRTTPLGTAGYIAYARREGGNCSDLQRGPGGVVYGEDGGALIRLTGDDYKISYFSAANYRVSYIFPAVFPRILRLRPRPNDLR